MSRFADRAATTTVALGPCECLGTPHESDWARVRCDLSASDIRRIAEVEDASDEALVAEVLAEFIPEWNLTGPDGQDWPPSAESLMALKAPTIAPITTALRDAVAKSVTVPNASSAPSRGSSRGSASRTPAQSRTPTT